MASHRALPIVIGIAVACGAAVALAQYGSTNSIPAANAPEQTPAPAAADNGPPPDMGAILMKGLKETPGCLGVEAAGTSSGKQVIFAFFQDKAAAMAWYDSPVHTKFRRMMPLPANDREPMENVPDGVPVMAVASISFKGEPAMKDSPIPFSQIAIELYTPLTGGININGGFSPDEFRALVKEPE